jgi:16S rRNA (cytidine1402-2'-O)-methyltransferase
MVAYHEHNEAQMVPRVLLRLSRGQDLALVSDAGTPLLSDPGFRLVAATLENGVPVIPIPGASALLAALVGAGLSTDRFTFFGFPARKGRDRDELLHSAAETRHTAILYEAANRVADTLAALAELGAGDREAVVARELTKKFEEFRRGSVAELAAHYRRDAPKGEVVILLAPLESPSADPSMLANIAQQLRASDLTPREIARQLSEEHGASRNLAYRLAHQERDQDSGT